MSGRAAAPVAAVAARTAGLDLALGPQDRRLLVALGGKNLGLLDALGGQDGGAAVALGAHLLLHGPLNGDRRVNGLQLHIAHADAPATGGLVQDPAQLAIDLVSAGQSLLQVQGADDVSQRRGSRRQIGRASCRERV